jgi:chemotaxis-related protein WspD
LANIRGELLVYVSLGKLFGIKKGTRYKLDSVRRGFAERLIVIQKGIHRFAYPVSEIYGIYRYKHSDLHEVPTTIAHASASYLNGIIEIDGRHVGCLDEELLFNSLERWLT